MKFLRVSILCFVLAVIAASFISCAAIQPKGPGLLVSNPLYIVGRIHKQWPGLKTITALHLGNVIVQDDEYYIPTPDEAWNQLHVGLQVLKSSDGDKYDCDDYAIDCMLRVQHSYLGHGVFAIGVLGYPGHMLNMIITTDGVLLYDVQNDVMQKPGPEIKPYFIWI